MLCELYIIILVKFSTRMYGVLFRYCRDIFERNYKTTIGVDFEVEKYRILGVPFSMQM